MRLLRNVPLAWKLGLSSLVTILLLCVLTWSVLTAVGTQNTLQDRVADATASRREAFRALVAMWQMRADSGRLAFLPQADAVTATAALLEAKHDEVAQHLVAMLKTARGPAVAAGRRAIHALGLYDLAAGRTALLRAEVLRRRDRDFLPSDEAFEAAVGVVRDGFDSASLSASDLQSLQFQIATYHDAIVAERDSAMLFLATGRSGANVDPANVDMVVQSLAPMILDTLGSDKPRRDGQAMLVAGSNLRAAAAALFAADRTLKEHVRTVLDPAAAALATQLGALLQGFDATAAQFRAEAKLAQGQMREHLLLLAGCIMLVLLASGWVTGRAIAGPIVAMTRAVQRMARGDTAFAVGFGGRSDEVGRMAAALEVLRGEVRRAHMQAQMLEQLPVAVMTCEPQGAFPTAYVNAETRRLLALVQADLPNAAQALLSGSLDAADRAPERWRALLGDPQHLPHRARVRLRGETFDLQVSPLLRDDGAYAGPMLSWRLVSQQVALSDRFEQSVGGIAQAVGRAAAAMQDTALGMSASAEGSGARLAAVAAASATASGNVQTVATNAEQLSASVAEIARQVAQSASIAAGAVAEAEATDRSVTGLAEAATRIGDVVRLIEDIAGRTNLLALNATIEAARAGEAGRGFAVVANEVKVLASQTARATGEIAAQITAMQGATGQAVGALRSIGATIGRMNEIATAIAGAVEQQGAATGEIARSVTQAAGGTTRVDDNIGALTGAVQQTGRQAGEVVTAARALSAQSETLGREVAEFLQRMRAAA